EPGRDGRLARPTHGEISDAYHRSSHPSRPESTLVEQAVPDGYHPPVTRLQRCGQHVQRFAWPSARTTPPRRSPTAEISPRAHAPPCPPVASVRSDGSRPSRSRAPAPL